MQQSLINSNKYKLKLKFVIKYNYELLLHKLKSQTLHNDFLLALFTK